MNQTICVSNLPNVVHLIESFGLANQDARALELNGKRLHMHIQRYKKCKCTHTHRRIFYEIDIQTMCRKTTVGFASFPYHLEDKLAVCFMNAR